MNEDPRDSSELIETLSALREQAKELREEINAIQHELFLRHENGVIHVSEGKRYRLYRGPAPLTFDKTMMEQAFINMVKDGNADFALKLFRVDLTPRKTRLKTYLQHDATDGIQSKVQKALDKGPALDGPIKWEVKDV